jgi:hypothetical protein
MQQRLEQAIDDGLVDLDLAALDIQRDRLAQRPRDLAHQAGKAAEHRRQRRQPDLADGGVQIGDQPVQLACRARKAWPGLAAGQALGLGGQVAEAALGDHQFVGEIGQAVDPLGVDPQRATAAASPRHRGAAVWRLQRTARPDRRPGGAPPRSLSPSGRSTPPR